MTGRLPAPLGGGTYDVDTGDARTGGPAAGADVPIAVRSSLEPPRFCAACGRRMVVQVRPDGWWAQCSRHGRVDSTDLESER